MTIIRRMARLIMQPLLRNGMFFITMYVLGVLCAVLTLPDTRGARLYNNLWLELFLDTYVACAVLALLPRKVRVWVRRLLYVVLYGVAIADVFCFWKFGSTITPSMLLLVGETDSREAGEFFSTYLNFGILFSPVGWILLLMAAHAAAAITLKHKAHPKSLPKGGYAEIPKRCRFCGSAHAFNASLHRFGQERGSVGLSTCVLALLVWSVCASWGNKRGMTRLMTADTIGTVEHILTEKGHGEFYLPIYRLAFSVYSNELASQQVERCIEASEKVAVDSCSFRSPNIVLIIGESYSKAHCQLYNYPVKDTPRQKKLEETGMLTKFSDVVSCWNLTSFVFKNFLSMHVIGQQGEWCDYPLFPELFRKAGYKVTFLTNQFLLEAKQAVYDFSGGVFLNNPTLSKAQFDLRNDKLHRFDNGLIKDYDHFVKEGKISLSPSPFPTWRGEASHSGNLIIFHLVGQHVSYNTRYPKYQSKFNGDDYKESRPDLNAKRRQMVAYYDNACLYNDSIVDAIVKKFDNDDAIVIYMPDHGEEIYEPGRDQLCRNHSSAVDWPIAHYEFEVPFWIWCSHKYAVRHPDVFKAIKDAKDKRFMTDALPHMMVWLAGIHSKDYHAQYNLLSPDYDEMRPRILKNSVDYDKLREQAMQASPKNNKQD